MEIKSFLDKKAVDADLKSSTKEEVVSELLDLLIESGSLDKKNKKKVAEVLMAREELGSTGIGQGIAIPHAKSDSVNSLVACLGISRKGIEFNALDGDPVHIFFLLVAPVDSAGPHLKALTKISRILKDKFIRDSLKSAKDEKIILKILEQEDARISAGS